MIPILVLLVPVLIQAASKESLDITTIYKFQYQPFSGVPTFSKSSTATKELHLRTNAIGRLYQEHNGTILGPKLGIPSIDCVHTASSCSWEKNDDWLVTEEDISEDVLQHLTAKIELSSKCRINNGGCQYKCNFINLEVVCSCPSGFLLSIDKKTCISENTALIIGTEGHIYNPQYPSYEYLKYKHSFLIIAPEGYNITMIVNTYSYQNSYVYAEVYDGNSTLGNRLGRFENKYRNPLTAGNEMLITLNPNSQQHSRIVHDFFYSTVKPLDEVLILNNEEGILKSPPVMPDFPGVCVSIVHKQLSTNDTLTMTAQLRNGQDLKITRSHYVTIGGNWYISRYRTVLSSENEGPPLKLEAHFTGQNHTVRSILGCNPFDDEDVYMLAESIPANEVTKSKNNKQIASGSVQQCFNGGVAVDEIECQCPSGFTGPSCYEGCGKNSYGNDCKGVCSMFDYGCLGMIFCKEDLPCMCAPGYTGRFCNEACVGGYYGASCRMPCGHCDSGTCNKYTGECERGCQAGYYPPLCQDTCKLLAKPPVVEDVGLTTASISFDLSNTLGRGTTMFYQIQYKEEDVNNWLELQPEESTDVNIVANITGLKSGVTYQTRVILIDVDGNSIYNRKIPTGNLQTLCNVPSSKQYNLKIENITSATMKAAWQYDVLSSTWCPLKGFEIIIQEHCRQNKYILLPTDTNVQYYNLLPGTKYEFKVRAITEHGNAPFSSPISATTSDHAPEEVTGLSAQRGGIGELYISWDKPKRTGGTIRRYRVEYECMRLLACSEPCSRSAGQLEVPSQSMVLTGLLPHAQYMVKVAGVAGSLGPYKTVFAGTGFTGATVAPDASPVPILERTNVSVAVQWQAPSNCSALNGYLRGYRYELVSSSLDGHPVLFTGSTQRTHVNLTDLSPDTQYEVHVYIVTIGGSNIRYKLVIPVNTSATTPDQVQDLTVYKRSRRMIGIRWSPPRMVYGVLKSFTVTYRRVESDISTAVVQTIEPVPCTAWPNLYCHTINRLVPDTQYLISVQARNTEVDYDGSAASVKTVTREGAPEAPTFLRVLNRTQTTLMLEWGPPDMINGVLRSFLVNVEQTDSLNATHCCDYIPIQELPVRGEEQVYRIKVTDLKPASTLTVSVSAKTVSLGASINLTTSTPPNVPTALQAPQLVSGQYEGDTFQANLKPAEEHYELDSMYLFLVLPPKEVSVPEPVLWDSNLLQLLKTTVNQKFYLVGEYLPEELSLEEEVNFGTSVDVHNGTLGQLQDPELQEGTYRIALVLVQDYEGAKSVGIAHSEPFTVG